VASRTLLCVVVALAAGSCDSGVLDVDTLPVEAPLVSMGGDMCPTTLRATGFIFETITCKCPSKVTGTIYGSNPYTADSNPCKAAKHAGVDISKPITLKSYSGCRAYKSSVRNGVLSTRWGKYDTSFIIPGKPLDDCVPTARHGGVLSRSGGRCGPTFKYIRGQRYSCTCNRKGAGSVWGSHPYTADSAICKAAFHAGVLTGPGKVTVREAPGCSKYAGTTKNGIKTSGWGQYPKSYVFEQAGKGLPDCNGTLGPPLAGPKPPKPKLVTIDRAPSCIAMSHCVRALVTASPENFKGLRDQWTTFAGVIKGKTVDEATKTCNEFMVGLRKGLVEKKMTTPAECK